MKVIKNILVVVAVVFVALYFFNPRIEEVKVPVTIEVKVPVIEKVHDTIEVLVPYETLVNSPINKGLKDSLNKANTTIDSLRAYKAFTVKRKYSQIFDDSTQTITVFAETTGTLDKLQASYKTKPRSIVIDTILTIPIPKYNEFYGGFSVGVPIITNTGINPTPTFKADLYLKTKNNNIWSVSFDTNKTLWVGHAWQF